MEGKTGRSLSGGRGVRRGRVIGMDFRERVGGSGDVQFGGSFFPIKMFSIPVFDSFGIFSSPSFFFLFPALLFSLAFFSNFFKF